MNLLELETASTVSEKSVLNASFQSSDNTDVLPQPNSPLKIYDFIRNKNEKTDLTLKENADLKLNSDCNEENIIGDPEDSLLFKIPASSATSNADLEIIRDNKNLSETFFTSRNSVCIQAPLMASTPFNPSTSAAFCNISTKNKKNLFKDKSEISPRDARVSWANELLMFITMHLDLEGIEQDEEKQKLLKGLIFQFKNPAKSGKLVQERLSQHVENLNQQTENIHDSDLKVMAEKDLLIEKIETVDENTLIPSNAELKSNVKEGREDGEREENFSKHGFEKEMGKVEEISSYDDDTDICEDLEFLNDCDFISSLNIYPKRKISNKKYGNNPSIEPDYIKSLDGNSFPSISPSDINGRNHFKDSEVVDRSQGRGRGVDGAKRSMPESKDKCDCMHSGIDDDMCQKNKIKSNRITDDSVSSELDNMKMGGECVGENCVFLRDSPKNNNNQLMDLKKENLSENHGICLTLNKAYSSSKNLNDERSVTSTSRESASLQSGQLILGVVEDVILDGCDNDGASGVIDDVWDEDHSLQIKKAGSTSYKGDYFSEGSSRQSLQQLSLFNNQHLNNNNSQTSYKRQTTAGNHHSVASFGVVLPLEHPSNSKPPTKFPLEGFHAGTESESGTWNFHGFKSELDSQTSLSLETESDMACDDGDHQAHTIPYKIPGVEEILYKRCRRPINKPSHLDKKVGNKNEEIIGKGIEDNRSNDNTLVSVEDAFDKTISSNSIEPNEQAIYINFSGAKTLRNGCEGTNGNERMRRLNDSVGNNGRDKNMLGGSLRELEKVNGEKFISDDLLNKWRGIMKEFKKRRKEDRKMRMVVEEKETSLSLRRPLKTDVLKENRVKNEENVRKNNGNKKKFESNIIAEEQKNYKKDQRKFKKSQSDNMPDKKGGARLHEAKAQGRVVEEKKKMRNINGINATRTFDTKLSEHYQAYLQLIAAKNPPFCQPNTHHSPQHPNNKDIYNDHSNNNISNENNKKYGPSDNQPREAASKCGIFKWAAETTSRSVGGGPMRELQVIHPDQPSLQQQLIEQRPDFLIRATNRRNRISHMMERRKKMMSVQRERRVEVVMRGC